MKCLLFLCLSVLSLVAKEVKTSAYIDVKETETATQLRTANITYSRGGQKVTLFGAIHIADKNYYKTLNEQFTQCDVVLFEMVGGEALEGRQPAAAGADPEADPTFQVLSTLYDGYAQSLDLSSQTVEIDYTAKNFVHADLSLEEYLKLTEEKGGSLVGLALALQSEGEKPNMARMLNAMLTKNSNALKRSMVGMMAGAGKANALIGDTVIIGDRNQAAFDVLKAELAKGHQHIGIFYGAAHLADMNDRLSEMGFTKVSGTWNTAWYIPK